MSEDYIVESGDCISSIAYEHGFFWQTLWSIGANAELRAKRKNPNVLMKGDVVHIPDLASKQESGATEMRHKFLRKGVPEKLRIKLRDIHHKPRANKDYLIVIDGNARRGMTDGNGELIESIPPNARVAKLLIGKDKPIILNLGHLSPVSETKGIKARLANLGFYKGSVDDNFDHSTKQALCAFQIKQGMPTTGAVDDATCQKLLQVHGH